MPSDSQGSPRDRLRATGASIRARPASHTFDAIAAILRSASAPRHSRRSSIDSGRRPSTCSSTCLPAWRSVRDEEEMQSRPSAPAICGGRSIPTVSALWPICLAGRPSSTNSTPRGGPGTEGEPRTVREASYANALPAVMTEVLGRVALAFSRVWCGKMTSGDQRPGKAGPQAMGPREAESSSLELFNTADVRRSRAARGKRRSFFFLRKSLPVGHIACGLCCSSRHRGGRDLWGSGSTGACCCPIVEGSDGSPAKWCQGRLAVAGFASRVRRARGSPVPRPGSRSLIGWRPSPSRSARLPAAPRARAGDAASAIYWRWAERRRGRGST